MSTDLAQAPDQAAATAESTATTTDGGGQTEAINDANGVQSQGQDNTETTKGEEQLPPELQEAKKHLMQDYHEKTQKLATEKKQMDGKLKEFEYSHQMLNQLLSQPWFKQAYDGEKAKRSGTAIPSDLSEDEFDKIKSDPRSFREFMQKFVESVTESKYGSKLSAADKEIKDLKAEREFEEIAKKYPDFRTANDAGALDEYFNKGLNFETAYALHKLRDGGKGPDIESEVNKVLAARKAAAVDKGGVAQVKGQRVIEARNWEEAFDRAIEAHAKGDTNIIFKRK